MSESLAAKCIVLSRRRTGASGLYDLVSQYTRQPNVGSEPFLWNRPLGHISRAFYDKRPDDVRRDLGAELERGVFFKHQYDTESYEFNLMLFDALAEAGYRVLHVERENEAERMFSAVVAMHFGAWNKTGIDQLRERIAANHVPITIDHEGVRQIVRADQVYRRWFDANYPVGRLPTLSMTYEQFYRDGIGALARADELFAFAGLGARVALLSDESLLRSTMGGEHYTLALLQYSEPLRQAYAVILDELGQGAQGTPGGRDAGAAGLPMPAASSGVPA